MAATSDKASDNLESSLCFSIPLPGGKVARIPEDVVKQYIQKDARVAHGPAPSKPAPASHAQAAGGQPNTTTIQAGESMITINIYAGQGEVAIVQQGEADDDVVAHSLSVDAATGMSDWHTDWEFGECEYTDEAGFPQRIQGWHRHPFGTEYSEIYES